MKRLYFSAVANRYARQVFLPYAAGLMWSYAKRRPEIIRTYEMCGMLFLKEPIEQALSKLEDPSILAISAYVWNFQWNKQLAQAVKKRWPKCVVLVGGVQVPDESSRILEENPEFDFGLYGEGEAAFADFLVEHATNERVYSRCGSLIWRDQRGAIHVNKRRDNAPLNEIPSPYLDGVFDEIVADKQWEYSAIFESNRGCPYLCTYCEWGAASLNKLRQFPLERLVAEIEWFGKNGVELLFGADANFAILKRDREIAEALTKTKEKYGYPKVFKACFAKNSNDVVLDISRMLHKAGMHKATTLALQSLNEETLGLVKRKNIRYDKLAELAGKYEAEGIPTFTEIIVGLPGETLKTYVDGIDKVLEAGIHDGISIYLCTLLENTEMNTPEYIREHGIESVPMKAMLYHATPEPGVVEEIQPTIIATKTMPQEDLRRAVLYGWLVQALHSFGLTQYCARTLRLQFNTAYQDFYVPLLDWALANPKTVLGRELARVAALWDGAVKGESWNAVDPRFGDVSWPPEEFLFLNVACDSDRFYDEIRRAGLVPMFDMRFIPPEPGKEAEYAREACWYGRKGPNKKLRIRESA